MKHYLVLLCVGRVVDILSYDTEESQLKHFHDLSNVTLQDRLNSGLFYDSVQIFNQVQ